MTIRARGGWRLAARPAALLAILALAGCGERAAPDSRTFVRRGGAIEEVKAGSRFRPPADGRVIVVPERGHLRFPADASYRLFCREGIEIPVVFEVDWRLVGDGAARRHAQSGSDSSFADAVVMAALRRSARPTAARLTAAAILSDHAESLRLAVAGALAAEPDLAFELRIASFDAGPLEEGAGRAGERTASPRRVLFVGVDAMDWLILDGLRAAGTMPNFDRLIRRGARADLQTLTPMLSPLLWTTMATGVGPDRHGILDFLVTDPATGKPIPVTSSMRRAPAFWNVATAGGRTVDLIGWLASWPAESIRGRLVSDRFGFLAYAAGAAPQGPIPDVVSPAALLDRLRPLVLPADQVTWENLRPFVDVTRGEFEEARRGGFEKGNVTNNLILTWAAAENYRRIGVEFLREPADLTAIYFEFLDAVGHLGMPYAPPRMSWVGQEDFRRYRRIVPAAYEEMDRMLGTLVAAAGDSTLIVVASDHGFLSGEARPPGSAAIEGGQAARWHRNPGVLIMAGPGVRRGAVIDRASVLDIAPTLLHLIGLPVSGEMEGQVITGAFTPEELAARPVRSTTRYALPLDVWAPPENPPARPAGAMAAPGAGESEGLDSLKAWNNLGLVLEQRGDLAGAESQYRKVLARAPDDANALNNLGNVLRRSGRIGEAATTLEELARRHPDYRPVLQNLGACYLEADQPARALPWFDRALAAEPGHVIARVNRGHALLRLGRADEAESDFRQAIRLEPRAANAWFGLGLVAASRGDLAAAREAFEKTLAIDPGHASARANLSRLGSKN